MASSSLALRFDTADALRGLPALDAAGRRAVRRALRRTAMNVRTVMVREVRQDIGLPAARVRDEIKLVIDETSLSATVGVTGKRIPLIEFKARGPEPSRGRGTGVRYRIGAGGRGHVRNAFIATVGRHRGVFIRANQLVRKSAGAWSKNLPIKELFGPSLPKVFEKFLPMGAERAREQFPKNLGHELEFALSRKG